MMSALYHHLRLLGQVLLALQACLLAAQAAAVVEFDLIFPRNDTYAPGPLMPVLFAIQNSATAASLNFTIFWEIYPLANAGKIRAMGGVAGLTKTNLTSGDPYFAVGYAQGLNGTEDSWVLRWDLRFANCSGSSPGTKVTQNSETRYHFFSTKPGALAPNLVQGPGSCVNSTGVAINVAETLPLNLDNSCLALASPPIVAANPCAVTVDNAMAALILGKNCGPDTATTCFSVSGAAQGAPVLVAWLLPVLAGLALYVAV